ncbi:putative ribonuclease H-like domain-containing protein [Tanacetum coccineum]
MEYMTITEASLRRHLKLEDKGGVTSLPNSEIFEQLALMRYVTDSDKLTFQKGKFSPQWRFFIHTILHCLSPKKTAWEQFSSNIAFAIICLATNRTFNFSKMIFDAMVKNVDSPHKFLMYPRFIQICLNMQKRHLQPHTRTYPAHSLTNKVFSNMKRVSRGYNGVEVPLFPTMLTATESSPSRITSSPSLSPEPSLSPQHTPSTSQPPNTQPTPDAEEAAPTPHESPLHIVHSLGHDEGSLSLTELRVLYTNLSNKVQEKQSNDTEVMLEEQEPIELIKDQGSREKGEKEVTTPANFQTYIRRRRDVSTGSSRVSTASRQDGSADVCTASEIGSTAGEKEKDKVKAIMTEAEPEKKIKLQQRQERSSLEAPIRLEEEFNEEETKRITKDAEIAKQLQEEIDIAGKKEAVTKDDEAHDIDWSDPSVIRYHALQNRPRSVAEVRKNMIMYLKNHGGYKMKDFKGMSYNDIRPIFEKVWDQVHSFVRVDEDLLNLAMCDLQTQKLVLNGSTSGIRACALRNFDLEDMESESTNNGTTAKLPILKLVTKMSVPVTAKEKTNKKNDVKARGLLLMALPNEHQLIFSQYPDAKSMFDAIETQFMEDLNLKFLSSLPPEWNTHVVVWMNKPEVDTISIDDLYNNFKIVEQKVKKSVGASSGAQNLAFMTAPSTSSTDDVNTASPQVSSVSLNVNTTSPQQIHEDDLEAMDLKWQLSLLSMRAKRYYQRTGKKIFINANDTARFDKSKVECFNCHKIGHFARECRAQRSKEGQFRNQDNTRKQGNNEDTSSKAMLAIDGVGFDWSDMAEEKIQTNMALMAFSDSKVYTDKTCSNNCLKNYETLKKQCDGLIVKLNESEFKATTYKRGLATLEDQIITYKKNEVLFSEEIRVLKRDVAYKDYELGVLKTEFEKVKQEKEGIDFKIEKFDKASKDLNQLLESQITDKSKKGLGFNAVPPPHPLIYNRPNKLDLSYSGLDEFKEPEFNGYGPRDTVLKSTIECDNESENSKENTDDSLVKEQVSEEENSSIESPLNVVKETVFHAAKKVEFVKPKNNEKPVRKSVRYTEMYRSQNPRGNQRNWNGQKSNQLGINIVRAKGVNAVKTRDVGFGDPPNLMGKPQMNDTGFVDSGCSRHMTSNMAYLLNFKEFDGGYVTFGGGAYGGRITDKGTLKTDNLNFDDVYFVNELKFNLFSVSHICDKKNYVLFTDIECLVLSPNFKLPDESQILLKIPRKDNMYSFDIKNIVPKEGIRRKYSVAITPQQNGFAERRNRTLIKAARTMLADFKLPTTFWAGAVSTACYVQNRVLVIKPHNKTPYELFIGFKPALSFMKPFGCHVTILNTLDSLGKFDGKSDEGFFVGYSLSSKAFRVYNTRTKKVEENLHVGFLENKPIIEGNGPKWLFDIDSLTQSMNYVPVTACTNFNESAGTQGNLNEDTSTTTSQDCIVMPIWKDTSYFDSPSKKVGNNDPKSVVDNPKQDEEGPNNEYNDKDESEEDSSHKEDNTADQQVNTASPGLNTGSLELNTIGSSVNTATPEDMIGASHSFEATHVDFFNDEYEPEVYLGNIPNFYPIRRMTQNTNEQRFISVVYEGKTHEHLHTCLFACFLSQEEPERISKELSHRAIGTKWIFRNKKDERGIVIRNKSRLVAQGHTQEEGIDYDEVFAPIARFEAIRLFLAYTSFMGFMVYQMDVKSVFLYGQIEEEVYVCQPPGFEDPDHPDKVYKVVKALYRLHQAPRAWYETLANYLLGNGFLRGKIDQTMFIKKQKGDIFLVQIYVDDIIFGSTKKELCTEFEKLMKDTF